MLKAAKAKCTRALNIIKFISHPLKDCNRKLLKQLYRSLIRYRLDYGVPLYNLARKSVVTLLDPIQSSFLRLALRASRTSPKLSLSVEAAEPLPPVLPQTYPILQFYVIRFPIPQFPIYDSVFLTHIKYPSALSNKHILIQFQKSVSKPFVANSLQTMHVHIHPWTLSQHSRSKIK